jgi:hypothetical protein
LSWKDGRERKSGGTQIKGGKARQGKARQGKARQGKARHGTAPHGTAPHGRGEKGRDEKAKKRDGSAPTYRHTQHNSHTHLRTMFIQLSATATPLLSDIRHQKKIKSLETNQKRRPSANL